MIFQQNLYHFWKARLEDINEVSRGLLRTFVYRNEARPLQYSDATKTIRIRSLNAFPICCGQSESADFAYPWGWSTNVEGRIKLSFLRNNAYGIFGFRSPQFPACPTICPWVSEDVRNATWINSELHILNMFPMYWYYEVHIRTSMWCLHSIK